MCNSNIGKAALKGGVLMVIRHIKQFVNLSLFVT